MNKLSDVKVPEDALLKKGYAAKDLLGQTFTVTEVEKLESDKGEYIMCVVEGDDIEAGKNLVTGSTNVMARLLAAKDQNLLPIQVTMVKLGTNAFDIV
jgi:hypothetical protein